MSYTDRELNVFEDLKYQRNLQHGYPCFIVGAKLPSPVSKTELSESLKQLVKQRIVLRSNVFNGVVKEIDFNVDDAIEVKDGDLVYVLNESLTTYFETEVELPLWKVVITGNWILVLYEHTLVDGNTAAFFVEDLILLLQGKTISEDYTADASPLFTAGYWDLLKHFWSSLVEKPKVFAASKNYSEFKTHKKIIQLNDVQFKKLKAVTKREKVSFTSLLTYLEARALKASVRVCIPVNLRKFLGPEAERAYGIIVSSIDVDVTLDENEIKWDKVRSVQSQISIDAQKAAAKKLGLLKFVDKKQYYLNQLKAPIHPAVEISNIGLRKLDGVDEFIFTQPNQASTYFSNDIASSSKVTNIVVSGPLESKVLFDDYVHALEGELLKLAI